MKVLDGTGSIVLVSEGDKVSSVDVALSAGERESVEVAAVSEVVGEGDNVPDNEPVPEVETDASDRDDECDRVKVSTEVDTVVDEDTVLDIGLGHLGEGRMVALNTGMVLGMMSLSRYTERLFHFMH